MWHVWKVEEVHVWFWYGNLKETGHLVDLSVDGKIRRAFNNLSTYAGKKAMSGLKQVCACWDMS
jgi:hypothetical protein